MRTLNETIEHYTKSAESYEEFIEEFKVQKWAEGDIERDIQYAEEYRQIVNWLSQLKAIYEIVGIASDKL